MKRYKSLALEEYMPRPNQRVIKESPEIQRLEALAFDGELGAIYTPTHTEFRLWAPTAKAIDLVIYEDYYAPAKEIIPMQKIADGRVWSIVLEGDCHGLTYRYRVTYQDDHTRRSVDPYSRAVTVNGKRSVE